MKESTGRVTPQRAKPETRPETKEEGKFLVLVEQYHRKKKGKRRTRKEREKEKRAKKKNGIR